MEKRKKEAIVDPVKSDDQKKPESDEPQFRVQKEDKEEVVVVVEMVSLEVVPGG